MAFAKERLHGLIYVDIHIVPEAPRALLSLSKAIVNYSSLGRIVRRAMEMIVVFNPANHRESVRQIWRGVFLTLLLDPHGGSPQVVATGASKSNLFFSSMFGSSAKPRFALTPKGQSTF